MVSLDATNIFWGAIGLLVTLAVLEYLDIWRKKGPLRGPKWVWPFVGSLFEMILSPYQFYENQEKFGGPLSWNKFANKFVLFSSKTEMTRKIFTNSENLHLWLTLGAKDILGENNIAFMHGPEHKALRAQLLHLFTKRALSRYITIQESTIRKFISKWLEKGGKEFVLRPEVRDLNVETSIDVFIGPYLDGEGRKAFIKYYLQMNEGFLSFPVNLPGTILNKAIKAREIVVDVYLFNCARQSRARLMEGGTPLCLLDMWMEKVVEDQKAGKPPLPHTSDKEIAHVVLDFLFASQDASTSSLVWTCCLLDSHPDVLEKIRKEQQALRPKGEPMSYELLQQMSYTRQVVTEILRYRPPATMVPHVAIKDTPIDDNYTIPKGAVILPSIWCSHHDPDGAFKSPEKFDPSRFDGDKFREEQLSKSFLAFGCGSHQCLGREYALNHLMTFAALLTTLTDFKRIRTPTSDNIIFGPTIFPEDGCSITMTPRAH